jgi:tRNA(Ile)-lysidine synthase
MRWRLLGRIMSDEDDSPISARAAKQLFAEFGSAPALVLAVSGGPTRSR